LSRSALELRRPELCGRSEPRPRSSCPARASWRKARCVRHEPLLLERPPPLPRSLDGARRLARNRHILPERPIHCEDVRAAVRVGKTCFDRTRRSSIAGVHAEGPVIAAARRQFLEEYARIRTSEGRGSDQSGYYRALPFQDLSGRNSAQWRIRARTFRYFAAWVLPRERADVLDLGAGNCWLSYRLAELRHRPVAIDIFSDARDGLGAARHYPVSFPVMEADFDRLPLPKGCFDLAVFNASFHYSPDYRRTLAEVRRCLRPDGRVVILDSLVYRRMEHGEQMRSERQAFFEQTHGF